ncbi:MAG: alpha/beta hydrolase [Pedobacter sp.]|uniref:alpha/beta fold hydrolase n=1 Tax=Pedobacter sp. TaxID=1411316 RepID=UPI00339885FA
MGIIEIEKQLSDITYKNLDKEDLKLDIYKPKSAAGRKDPVVIFIHGGGWATGDKSEIRFNYQAALLQALLEKGYAVISIDYRLTDLENIHFPAPVIDCKDAVRWVHKNAELYHFDADHIGVWGTSAGAHMAMLLAYSDDKDFYGADELITYSAKVNYVFNNYGPVDLNQLFKPELGAFKLGLARIFLKRKYNLRQSRLTTFSGMDIENQKKEVISFTELYSPVKYIAADTVPTFTIHGDNDQTVPLKQAKILDKALTKNNVPHQLIVYPGQGHGLKTLSKDQIAGLSRQFLLFISDYDNI